MNLKTASWAGTFCSDKYYKQLFAYIANFMNFFFFLKIISQVNFFYFIIKKFETLHNT